MKEFRSTFAAGEEIPYAVAGNYFRLMAGSSDIKVTFPESGMSTNFPVGVGVSLERFTQLRIYSEVAQTIVFAVAVGRVDDSRVITVEQGGSSYSAPEIVALVAGTAKEVLPANVARFKASMQADADMYIGADNTVTTANGIKLAAGSLVNTGNSAAVWCISPSATNVRILQEFA